MSDDDLTMLNLADPVHFADGPPHQLFDRMRRECPVRWNRLGEDDGFWSLTRDSEITTVSRDPERFSSAIGGVFLHPDQVMPLDIMRTNILYMDPPEHTKYRKILQSVFSSRAIRELEPAVRRRVTDIIDAVIEKGECDFVSDFAVQVPLAVLADLMGLPQEDTPKLYEWTHAIEEAQRDPEPAGAVMTFMEMASYLVEQVDIQLAAGGDSLVTRLREAEVDEERLTEDEILTFFGLLVFAGNDTTRNTTSTGMLTFLEHPEQWKQICDDPSLIPGAVEEVLRYTSVVQYFSRTATEDTELDGQQISKGDKVVTWFGSASRDADLVPDPQRFDISRRNQDHRAFGGGGRHFCLGAGLARLELRVIFEELSRRVPDIRLTAPIERWSSSWVHGLTSMPVTFTPGERVA